MENIKTLSILGISLIMSFSVISQEERSSGKSPRESKKFSIGTELQYIDDESCKEISFIVGNVYTRDNAQPLISLLIKNNWVLSCDFDYVEGLCSVKAKVNASKKDIINILGSNGYKISNYSEKVNLVVSSSNISNIEKRNQEFVRRHPERYKRVEYVRKSGEKNDEGEVGLKVSEIKVTGQQNKISDTERLKHLQKFKEIYDKETVR
ncbi:MAG: hypothetical protein HY738_11685 [Bacteroidia bacterium]|nr:hypothetical protein [Bacteroidia bacterium]